jgi:hypothetical protein
MRTLAGIMIAAVLTAGALATEARADGTWRAPNGRFTFTFPESWGVVEPPARRPREVLAHFGQTTTLVERKECFVDRVPAPRLPGDQSAINETLANWTGQDALNHIGGSNAEATITAFENVEVDGVRTLKISFTVGPLGNARGLSRQFVLAEGGAAIRYGVHCVVIDQGAHITDVEALLASLHFAQSESTP